jgi:hypothetical protein
MKTLREMMDLIESAQLPANEGWGFRFKKPDPTLIADKQQLANIGKERIEQLLKISGLIADNNDTDLLIDTIPGYMKNNQIDIGAATGGIGALSLLPFVQFADPSLGTTRWDATLKKSELKKMLQNFVNQLNQELQKNISKKVDEASPDALAKIDDLTRK